MEIFKIESYSNYLEQNQSKMNKIITIKYKNHTYKIGDNIQISLKNKISKKNEEYFVKIIEIFVNFLSKECVIVLIKVCYYLPKFFIPDIEPFIFQTISPNELFYTDIEEIISVNEVIQIYSVLNQEEYENSPEINAVFTQGNYSFKNHSFNPTLESRKKICLCKLPQNPDLNYIMCEQCKEWFHFICVGIKENDDISSLEFYCRSCNKTNF